MIRSVMIGLLFAGAVLTQEQPRDLRGIWEAPGAAYRNLEGVPAKAGQPAAKSVVIDPPDGRIPYRAEARKTADRNFRERESSDPLLSCFQPGIPRATLLPEPFQIFQNSDRVVIVYQHVHAYRVIFTDGRAHYDDGIEFYMGDSRARWDGNALVVDVTNFKPETWLDNAGNFHGARLHVVERYSRIGADTLRYEATIEDPEVFERPWTIRLDLTRHTEPNFQLLEHECERDAKGVYRHPPQFLK
ncbi:MAG TPA: hypothetical protein VFY29_09275 [Terriglobia bacterium]|nr:hypothetical protein [Terriglobia bacterium]